jgi:hypothetical protein
MQIHGDTAFTPHERELIETAILNIRMETANFVDIHIDFDLDFDSMTSVSRNLRSNILVRVQGTNTKASKETLGYCIADFQDLSFDNPARATLIYDRLPNDASWIHVSMHEILHMIRLEHVDDFWSVMNDVTPVEGRISTCLSEADVIELCTVHGCDPAGMTTCDVQNGTTTSPEKL